MTRNFRKTLMCTAIACCVGTAACSQSGSDSIVIEAVPKAKTIKPEAILQTDSGSMSADIRYTSYGVPHIKSESYEGLGFGVAYAFAGDNICLMAEQYITLRGERAKYLGVEGKYHDIFAEALGEEVHNVDSDFYHKLIFSNVAAHQKAGTGPELQKIVVGWVEGYNKFITDNAGQMPAKCNNADWVKPITENDVYRRFLQSSLLGGYGTFMKPIADATVPTQAVKKSGSLNSNSNRKHAALSEEQTIRLSKAFKQREYGSNAIAFGKDLTPKDQPMMFANPHFPWAGSERLYQMHLTIPGVYDFAGAGLYGIPIPQLGYSKDIAWSVTWSTDIRFLIRELKLNKANQTQYYVDGKLHDMDVVSIDVDIKNDDGSMRTETRTAYNTIYGPLVAGQYFKGSKKKAFAITDFNAPNNRAVQSYFEIGQAKTVAEFDAIQAKLTGLPYSNLTGVDKSGTAYYSNKSIAANVTDAQIDQCLHGMRAKLYKKNFGVVVLDGSDSTCNPAVDPTTPQAGILAAKDKPSTIRSDYTAQTNDSHWIANADPSSFNSGYGYVVGEEQTERSDRLRHAVDFINKRKSGSDNLAGTTMTPENMHAIFYRAGLAHGESMKDDLIADCEANGGADLAAACEALKKWDGSESADSVGGHIFREFYRNISSPTGDVKDKFWKVPFDPAKPLTTPSGLKASGKTRKALAKAVKDITNSGIALDARLGDIQFVTRNGERIPVSGGQGFHRLSTTFVPGQGYTDPIVSGDSYIFAVSIGPDGPQGMEVNAYSQSTDPASIHSYDQTKIYGDENWAKIRFSDAEIEADPNYKTVRIEK